ncbi:mitochondrial outer membrane protein porin of 36 kDa-like [Ipomoea triloba]|uniref:mitochondrial outer membrane protein porin of 36 kDa-like n=1 Tax=Ipomoea triloba TaxID=35885 RepID=UPI00125E7E0E|nr:mitochondrial outer membrane protein porin of 36 kDa-like [Ipomoea triloba]
MSKHPGTYHDIGKKARDVLYKDYIQQPDCYNYRWLDWSFRLVCKVKILHGLSTIFRYGLPYQRSNRVEVQYLQNYFGVTTGISLARSPSLNFSGSLGNGNFCVGTDLSFDTAAAKLAKYDASLSFNTALLSASLALKDKFDTLKASCDRTVNPDTNTVVAAEVVHRFFSNQTTLTFGVQHSLLPSQLMKARVATDGGVAAMIQYQLFSALCLTIAGETNLKHINNSPKLGMSLTLRH